jgi:hypothetical protein
MPTIREARYATLRKAGFLRSEALAFSKFDWRATPYIAQLVTQRAVSYNNFKNNNKDLTPKDREKQWENRIQKLCLQNGWYKDWKNAKGETKRVIDPWAELRQREDSYKPKHPSYESPHVKKWRDFQSFEAKLNKNLRYSS